MDVEIERQRIVGVGKEAEALEPRFFARLAQRDPARVALAIGVAPELEPAIELAVVGEQRVAVIGREDPRRGRDVTLAARALEERCASTSRRRARPSASPGAARCGGRGLEQGRRCMGEECGGRGPPIAAGLRLPNGVEASRRAGVRSRASRHGRAGA
jgi:hypothetical protein